MLLVWDWKYGIIAICCITTNWHWKYEILVWGIRPSTLTTIASFCISISYITRNTKSTKWFAPIVHSWSSGLYFHLGIREREFWKMECELIIVIVRLPPIGCMYRVCQHKPSPYINYNSNRSPHANIFWQLPEAGNRCYRQLFTSMFNFIIRNDFIEISASHSQLSAEQV